MWGITAMCLALTILFWFLMNNSEIEYEKVLVTVISTSTKEVVNKKTQNRTQFYEVKVEYNKKEYNLQNVHGLSGYYEGRNVEALLANDKLYANVEGIKSTSPVAIVYFIFLFGTLGMLMLTTTFMSKAKQKNVNT